MVALPPARRAVFFLALGEALTGVAASMNTLLLLLLLGTVEVATGEAGSLPA